MDEGLRALDITNPAAPVFTGYFLSPPLYAPGRQDRQTRDVFQGPKTQLLYVTDANGAGLTVLKYTGPFLGDPPIPGAR